MFKYSINTSWSDEDECYVAIIPEFPGLSAFGETPEEAVREAQTAVKGFIKVYEEDGCELPEPYKISSFSGQTRLRLPKSLHASLSQEAQAEGAIASLAKSVTTEVTVLREGQSLRIPSQDLVPGDVVLLTSGDKVPADLRLLKVRSLQIDESALTGEG